MTWLCARGYDKQLCDNMRDDQMLVSKAIFKNTDDVMITLR